MQKITNGQLHKKIRVAAAEREIKEMMAAWEKDFPPPIPQQQFFALKEKFE